MTNLTNGETAMSCEHCGCDLDHDVDGTAESLDEIRVHLHPLAMGKSGAVPEGVEVTHIDLTQCDPEDMTGLPVREG